MTNMARSPLPAIDIDDLGFDRGAHLLVRRGLRGLAPGDEIEVRGSAPGVAAHLRAWCRSQGHALTALSDDGGVVRATLRRGSADVARWSDAEQAGRPNPRDAGGVVDQPPARWGLAARGATVENGGPAYDFGLGRRAQVWADDAPRLYAQAAAQQWDPATAVDWNAPVDLDADVESAVVQVMTYLVENENAALLVPARFLSQVHPHFREVLQVLAVQVADEARHVEVFTRRALLHGGTMGTSSAGGAASLHTLFEERDFAVSSFLLSVLGEGSFLSLLAFLQQHAPDPVTRQVSRLAHADEARHVAFGMAHLVGHLRAEPALRDRLAAAVERRHDALADAAGLNDDVFDSLVVLAAGAHTTGAIARGWDAVQQLQADMDRGRRRRLVDLGFPPSDAAALSALHTRNFM
jgi:TusA-related sulfurtransferase